MKRFTLLLWLCSCFAGLNAANVYVSTSGADALDGSSWATAKLSLQAAVDAALDGDTVFVSEGVYNQAVKVKKSVNIFGGYAATTGERNPEIYHTILDGTNLNSTLLTQVSAFKDTTFFDGLILQNAGEHCLHGGYHGFNDKVWDVVEVSDTAIRLHYLSPDGEEGFPGNLHVYVTYLVKDKDLIIQYEASTDAPTILNLTNHAYFNLKGEGNGTIHDHTLQVMADEYIPYDDKAVPLGNIAIVEQTPMDMRDAVLIADRIDLPFFASGLGIDNGWALPGWDKHTEKQPLQLAAILEGGGRTMETWTTFPCMQVYSGNYVEKHVGKSGQTYDVQCAICLEAEMFPDAIHYPLFPNTILRPGEEWLHTTVYRFL